MTEQERLENQLKFARYHIWKVNKARYHDMLRLGLAVADAGLVIDGLVLTKEEAEAKFNMAMRNYDGNIEAAANGAWNEACAKEMELGFDGKVGQ